MPPPATTLGDAASIARRSVWACNGCCSATESNHRDAIQARVCSGSPLVVRTNERPTRPLAGRFLPTDLPSCCEPKHSVTRPLQTVPSPVHGAWLATRARGNPMTSAHQHDIIVCPFRRAVLVATGSGPRHSVLDPASVSRARATYPTASSLEFHDAHVSAPVSPSLRTSTSRGCVVPGKLERSWTLLCIAARDRPVHGTAFVAACIGILTSRAPHRDRVRGRSTRQLTNVFVCPICSGPAGQVVAAVADTGRGLPVSPCRSVTVAIHRVHERPSTAMVSPLAEGCDPWPGSDEAKRL